MTRATPHSEIRLPGCKSAAARALVLATFAEGESVLSGLPQCLDSDFLLAALQDLGLGIQIQENSWILAGGGVALPHAGLCLEVGESATNLRFLLALGAVAGWQCQLRVGESLAQRSQQDLLAWLSGQGVVVGWDPGRAIFQLPGRSLSEQTWQPPFTRTSQLASGLLLAAPLAGGAVLDFPTDGPSSGYFGMTTAWARKFRGAEAVVQAGKQWTLSAALGTGQSCLLPADASAASFFLVRCLLRGDAVRFDRNWDASHPETKFFNWLLAEQLLELQDDGVWQATGHQPISQLRFDLASCPDCGPALAVAATQLPLGVEIHGVARLRGKESDRRQGMLDLVEALGGNIVETHEDSMQLAAGKGGSARQVFPTQGDHRLAMAAGIAELPVDTPEVVEKSFRGFWQEVASDLESPHGQEK